jgi:hypothetical protein
VPPQGRRIGTSDDDFEVAAVEFENALDDTENASKRRSTGIVCPRRI